MSFVPFFECFFFCWTSTIYNKPAIFIVAGNKKVSVRVAGIAFDEFCFRVTPRTALDFYFPVQIDEQSFIPSSNRLFWRCVVVPCERLAIGVFATHEKTVHCRVVEWFNFSVRPAKRAGFYFVFCFWIPSLPKSSLQLSKCSSPFLLQQNFTLLAIYVTVFLFVCFVCLFLFFSRCRNLSFLCTRNIRIPQSCVWSNASAVWIHQVPRA